MLSPNQIDRLFRTDRLDVLVQEIAEHTLGLPLALRLRLSQSPASAVALGLLRLGELTYSPTAAALRMTDWLLTRQAPDGSFDADPLATACAAAALRGSIDRSRSLGIAPSPAIERAHQRAIESLAASQTLDTDPAARHHHTDATEPRGSDEPDILSDGPFFQSDCDRSVEDRALVAAFILTLLASDPLLVEHARTDDLLDWFDRHHARIDDHTHHLAQLARITLSHRAAFTPGHMTPLAA